MHQGLRKAESSLAIELRTGENRFCSIFCMLTESQTWSSRACQCGWRCQDVKTHHYLLSDLRPTTVRSYNEEGRYRPVPGNSSDRKGEGFVQWPGGSRTRELLAQFSLAKEQIDLLEGRTSNDGNGDGDGNGATGNGRRER